MMHGLMKHGRLLTNKQKNKMGLGAEMCEFCDDLLKLFFARYV
jgi:hypothetical protein